jgi:TPR repeat protein
MTNCRFFGILALALLVAACTTVPVKKHGDNMSAAQRQEAQRVQFSQGRALFLSKQYDAAAAVLLPLAKQGHLDAQYTIGYMYHYGYGVPRNEKESLRWIALAAGRGHPQAKEALARINAAHDVEGVVEGPPPNPGSLSK